MNLLLFLLNTEFGGKLMNNISATTPSTLQDNHHYTIKELQDIKYALDQAVIVAITDNRGRITFVNEQFCDISQYTYDELIGQDHRILNSKFHPKSFFRDMWRTIGSGKEWTGEVCNRAKDGSLYWVKTTIVPFLNEYNKPYQYIALRTNITSTKDMKAISEIANHDQLTGLPNRQSLHARITNEILKCKQEKSTFAVFDLDINRFKSINDGFGHTIGDQFLVEVADRLRSIGIGPNYFYRQAADEFALVLTDVSNIDEIALAIMHEFKRPFIVNGNKFYASVSIGISLYPEHGRDAEILLNTAGQAMTKAKGRTGNNYFLYNTKLESHELKDILLETKLFDAIRDESLQVFYQPKIDLKTEKIVGMEALIRWFDDELGFIPPDRFIPFAEKSGLIISIGKWVFETACWDTLMWNNAYNLNLQVAVNMSPIQLAASNIVESIEEILEETRINPNSVEIEITEMSMVDYTDELINKIQRIRDLGITISIDDFGTGYSSLSYLKNLPVDALKIDRSFVSEITQSDTGTPMIAAIISLAHALKLQVVAEGVELPGELAVLKQYGCEYAQGYYFSKPLPPEDFVNFIKMKK